MTCFDLFFLEKGQEAREHAHAVFDRVDAEVFAFGVEAATGRGNTVNDGSAGLGDAIGVGTAAGVDPARFKAFEAGGFVDEFDEFARLFRAGHGRGDGGAAGVDGDAVAPVHGGELDRVGGVRVLTPPYHTTHRTDP